LLSSPDRLGGSDVLPVRLKDKQVVVGEGHK